jgi:hypothetical protein
VKTTVSTGGADDPKPPRSKADLIVLSSHGRGGVGR